MNLDLLNDTLQTVLNCVCSSLESGICQDGDGSQCGCPCRTYISAGPVVWDNCCDDGQLTAHVDRLFQYKLFPSQSSEPSVCATELAAEVVITLLRCWPANLHENGAAPTKDEINTASTALYRDMILASKATICCLNKGGKSKPFVFNGARVIGPQGGCAGVEIRFVIPVY